MTTTHEDIAEAKKGNMEPLLARLRAGVVVKGKFENHIDDPGDWGNDDTWFDVQDAHMDGDLTDEQYEQCAESVRNITPEEYEKRNAR